MTITLTPRLIITEDNPTIEPGTEEALSFLEALEDAETAAASATAAAAAASASAAAAEAAAALALAAEEDTVVTATGGTEPVALSDRFGFVLSVEDFGAVGDGVTDDTAAINAALTAVGDSGGGQVWLNRSKRYLVDSDDLTIPKHTFLMGHYENVGEEQSRSYSSVKAALLLNPTYTIRILGDAAGLRGIAIFNKNLVEPTNLRTSIDLVKSFSGTAVTVGQGPSQSTNLLYQDTYVGHCFIAGFETAYFIKNNERPRVEYVSGDCTNGIYMERVTDMCHVMQCHFWPFLTTHENWTFSTFTVTGTANNGGKVQLSIGSHTLEAGDKITVQLVTGTTEANGTWLIDSVGATTITLAGSTYANAWVSGGTVSAIDTWHRRGTAYKFFDTVDWGQISNSFCYGYQIGFDIEESDHCTLVNCGADAYANAAERTAYGFWIHGDTKATALIGCKAASMGYKYYIDINSATEKHVTMTGCRSWGTFGGVGFHVYHVEGNLFVTGHQGQTGGSLYFDNSIDSSRFLNCDLSGISLSYEGSTARSRVAFIGCAGLTIPIDGLASGTNYVSDANGPSLTYTAASASGEGWQLNYNRARGTAFVPTAVSSGDNVHDSSFIGHDGTQYTQGFLVRYEVDGSPSSGRMPIRVRYSFQDQSSGSLVQAFELDSKGNIVLGRSSLATSATDGFTYIAGGAGAPSGVPTSKGGRAPLYVDTTNNKLYFYSGGAWRDAGP